MRIRIGYGGWIAVDSIGLPGPLYVRVRDENDRLRIKEFYLDASQSAGEIDASDLRQLPLTQLEMFINANAQHVRSTMPLAAPDLSTYASYYKTGFGNMPRQIQEGHWIAASFAAQHLAPDQDSDTDPESGVRIKRVPRARDTGGGWQGVRTSDREFRLESGPAEGLTDDFLRGVAKAYEAAVLRGEKPNVAISEQTGYPLRSVQRWVYTARQRRIIPPGKPGKAG